MYVDLAGLARYKQDFDAWARRSLLPKDAAAARVRTAKAGAVSFVPVQETPLDVSVDFLFTETPPASGDKGPDNPSTIAGVSSVNVGRVGKNLLLKVASTQTVGTVTMTPQNDGSYIFNGAANGNVNFVITDCGPEFGTPVYSSVHLDVNKNYTLTATILEGSITGTFNMAFGYGSESGQYVNFSFTNSVASYTFNSSYFPDGRFIARLRALSGASFSNAKIVFQLEEGETATAFEDPMLPADANNTLSLGNTYYGGSVDLSAGTMTVTWAKHIFNASNNFTYNVVYANDTSSGFYLSSNSQAVIGLDIASVVDSIACNRFPVVTVSNFYGTDENIYKAVGASLMLRLNNSRLSPYGYVKGTSTASQAVAALGSWLADNPVELVYNLATPYTVQLTPQQIYSLSQPDPYAPRINTVYSDQISVQVGYPKSPQASQTELTNAIVSLGGNV